MNLKKIRWVGTLLIQKGHKPVHWDNFIVIASNIGSHIGVFLFLKKATCR